MSRNEIGRNFSEHIILQMRPVSATLVGLNTANRSQFRQFTYDILLAVQMGYCVIAAFPGETLFSGRILFSSGTSVESAPE